MLHSLRKMVRIIDNNNATTIIQFLHTCILAGFLCYINTVMRLSIQDKPRSVRLGGVRTHTAVAGARRSRGPHTSHSRAQKTNTGMEDEVQTYIMYCMYTCLHVNIQRLVTVVFTCTIHVILHAQDLFHHVHNGHAQSYMYMYIHVHGKYVYSTLALKKGKYTCTCTSMSNCTCNQ